MQRFSLRLVAGLCLVGFIGLSASAVEKLEAAKTDKTPTKAAAEKAKAENAAAPTKTSSADQAKSNTAAEPEKKPAEAGTKHTLRYKFQAGETLRWQVVHRVLVETTVSGTTQTAETTSSSTKAWLIKSVAADGSITFENSVEDVDMRTKLSGRMEVHYNSKTDSAPPHGFESIAKSVGVPLSRVHISAQGKVLGRERITPQPNQENEGQITLLLPENPVTVGQTWSQPSLVEIPLPGGGLKKIRTMQTFTLMDVKTGVATIHFSTQILSPIDDPAVESQLIQRELAGTVRFDIDAGRTLGQQMDIDKRVVGFRGQASTMHYVTRFTEQLQKEEPKTAARPAKKDSGAAK